VIFFIKYKYHVDTETLLEASKHGED